MLCRPDDLAVTAVIELDDQSHQNKSRIKRDIFLEAACDAAGLTLYRFKASRGYKIMEIRDTLVPAAHTESAVSIVDYESVKMPTQIADEPEIETCPKCQSQLVRKVARKGKHQGETFLACSVFPKCRYIKPLVGETTHG